MDLGLLEVERKMHILAVQPHKIAVGGSAHIGLVQRQFLAVLEQRRLDVAIRPHLELSRARGQHDWPAILHIHADGGRLGGHGLVRGR